MFAALPASAQDPDKRVDFNFGAGATITTGALNDHLGSGYNINFGITINANPKVGINAEYSFNGMGQKQISVTQPTPPVAGCPPGGCQNITTGPFSGDMNMQYGDFNLVYRPMSKDQRSTVYFVAGGGVYYRPIKVTTPGAGYVPGYCDPFWYYCSPGGWVPVENIIGSRSSTDFGIDFGGGLNVRMSDAASFYFEVRYHYIWGPTFTASSTTYNSNSAFIPITLGIRF
jgi:opacity protein-like surface antigen